MTLSILMMFLPFLLLQLHISPLTPSISTPIPLSGSFATPTTPTWTLTPPPLPQPPTHHNVIRSRIGSLKPRYIFNLSTTSDISTIPQSIVQALCDPHCKSTMDSEMYALTSNHTWILCILLHMPILFVIDGYTITSLKKKATLITIKDVLFLQAFLNSLILILITPSVMLSNLPQFVLFLAS